MLTPAAQRRPLAAAGARSSTKVKERGYYLWSTCVAGACSICALHPVHSSKQQAVHAWTAPGHCWRAGKAEESGRGHSPKGLPGEVRSEEEGREHSAHDIGRVASAECNCYLRARFHPGDHTPSL